MARTPIYFYNERVPRKGKKGGTNCFQIKTTIICSVVRGIAKAPVRPMPVRVNDINWKLLKHLLHMHVNSRINILVVPISRIHVNVTFEIKYTQAWARYLKKCI